MKYKEKRAKNRNLYFVKIFIFVICSLSLGGCESISSQTTQATQEAKKTEKEQNKIISDIAYDVIKKEDCVIYIEESDGFAPYLVISSNYGGNTLLLRKYLLDDTMPFNENEKHMWAIHDYGGYYENSSIDIYLNMNFFNTL